MKSYIWLIGIVALFVLFVVYNKKEEYTPEVAPEEQIEYIPPPDDEVMSMGIGPGTFGFGRFGDTLMT